MNKEREKKRAWLLLRAQLDKYLFLTFIQPVIWLVLPIWSCLCVCGVAVEIGKKKKKIFLKNVFFFPIFIWLLDNQPPSALVAY